MTRPGSRLSEDKRIGIVRDLLTRQGGGDLGDSSPDIFGGDVLTQAEIAEKWRASASTVNKMAIDLEQRQRAGLDVFDFSS
jgi:hypothetical protein